MHQWYKLLSGRNKMVYLMMHSTHFNYIYDYVASGTWIRITLITSEETHFLISRHMVKDHSDNKRGNLLLPQGFFYMHHPTDRIAHTMAFVASVMFLLYEIFSMHHSIDKIAHTTSFVTPM